jgi:hypothetical protein
MTTALIQSPLKFLQQAISGNAIDQGGKPFEKLHKESCQTLDIVRAKHFL